MCSAARGSRSDLVVVVVMVLPVVVVVVVVVVVIWPTGLVAHNHARTQQLSCMIVHTSTPPPRF